jgi:hypothetical protein
MTPLLVAALIDPTALATESCSRRMAQLAASYGIVSLSAQVASDAVVLEDGGFEILLRVTIHYPREVRQAVIACTVSRTGKVRSLEGLTRQP